MNLGKYIAEILLEQDKETIALFPGAFKPPHKGHFAVVEELLKKGVDKVIVLISPKEREGINVDMSVKIWDVYKTLLDDIETGKVEIKIATESPVKEAYNLVKENPDVNFIVAVGKGEIDRFKHMGKHSHVQTFDAGQLEGEGMNATGLRAAIGNGDASAIQKYIPAGVSATDFIGILEKPMNENNHQTTDDVFVAYVAQKEHDIEKAAQKFNVPLEDMKYAFTAGSMIVLSDDIWSKLENTNSFGVRGKYFGELPTDPALVVNYDKDRYYLVSGENTLRKFKAAGQNPKVLLAVLDLPNEKAFYLTENEDTVAIGPMKLKDEQIDTITEFIKYAAKALGLQNLPSSLTLSYDTKKAKTRHTFGYFDPSNNKIWLYVKDRNVADILRTLAHELVHRKQAEQGRIETNSGDTGSEIENEANAQAGVLLRNFGKTHEEIYEHKK
jgi:hypothetical protein